MIPIAALPLAPVIIATRQTYCIRWGADCNFAPTVDVDAVCQFKDLRHVVADENDRQRRHLLNQLGTCGFADKPPGWLVEDDPLLARQHCATATPCRVHRKELPTGCLHQTDADL